MTAPTLPSTGPGQPKTAWGSASPRRDPAQNSGRLMVPPGRRRPGLVAAGAAALAVFAAAGWLLYQRAGDTTGVLVVARAVPVGARVTAADLAVAQEKADPALQLVRAGDERSVVGQIASVALRPGTTLSLSELGGAATPSAGDQIVGVSLKPGFLPSRSLVPGDRVDLDGTGSSSAGSSTPGSSTSGSVAQQPSTVQAVVTGVGRPDADGAVVVDVEVPNAAAASVAAEASAGQLVLTLLPGAP